MKNAAWTSARASAIQRLRGVVGVGQVRLLGHRLRVDAQKRPQQQAVQHRHVQPAQRRRPQRAADRRPGAARARWSRPCRPRAGPGSPAGSPSRSRRASMAAARGLGALARPSNQGARLGRAARPAPRAAGCCTRRWVGSTSRPGILGAREEHRPPVGQRAAGRGARSGAARRAGRPWSRSGGGRRRSSPACPPSGAATRVMIAGSVTTHSRWRQPSGVTVSTSAGVALGGGEGRLGLARGIAVQREHLREVRAGGAHQLLPIQLGPRQRVLVGQHHPVGERGQPQQRDEALARVAARRAVAMAKRLLVAVDAPACGSSRRRPVGDPALRARCGRSRSVWSPSPRGRSRRTMLRSWRFSSASRSLSEMTS